LSPIDGPPLAEDWQSMKLIHLVVIDGQNDFVDPKGTLSVRTADAEAENLAAMVDRLGEKIFAIHATLDAHHPLDIGHPQFWVDEKGNHPTPFTTISADDVTSGRWRCALSGYFDRSKKFTYQDKVTAYAKQLTKNGRYPLCIWPPHCLIGSTGQNVYPPLLDAYSRWIEKRPGWVNFITKGEYPFSEHYSAIQADVPEPTFPSTQINIDLLELLARADIVLWAGWAGSHSLANTCRDAMNFFGVGRNMLTEKSILLTDVCAPAGDTAESTVFHDLREQFVKEMKNRGMKLATSKDVLS
jgi:nicotinamidase/pyrazinamidase